MKKALYFLIFSLFFIQPAFSQDKSYLNELLTNAKKLNLSQDIQWHRLLHLKKSLIGLGYHSLIDEPEFFLAKDFGANPEKELEETIKAFFVRKSSQNEDLNLHAQCKFPARYFWLKKKLSFDSSRLPEIYCPAFREWEEALAPSGLTMIFPTSFLNNPASMFGHTLFRIDAKGQDEKTRLLAYGASYAAGTNESSGLVFAVRGIFGGYLGAFSIAPYYQKVKEYSDLENRDVWEYELNITQDQLDLLVKHLWEMKNTYFDYYFFDENCSYHLLSLLDLAKPELNLSDQFNFWAIPIDTVKATVAEPGLLKKIIYRPSKTTIIKSKLKDINSEEKDLVLELSKGKINFSDSRVEALSEEEKVKVLGLAIDYVGYIRLHAEEERAELDQREFELLTARSKLKSDPLEEKPLQAFLPENGHKTRLASLGLGYNLDSPQKGKQLFSEFLFRPAYHDLLSPQEGYVDGSGISFFEFKLRKYEEETLSLESFMPLKIISLTPRDDFFKKYSFNVQVGANKEIVNEAGERKFLSGVDGGLGLSYQLLEKFVFYNFLNADFKLQDDFKDNYRFGFSYQPGAYFDLNENWRVLTSGKVSSFVLGEDYTNLEFNFEQRYSLSQNNTVNLGFKRLREFGEYYSEVVLGFRVYF